jgi:hypothetical protein
MKSYEGLSSKSSNLDFSSKMWFAKSGDRRFLGQVADKYMIGLLK